jgi:hypothetical protein
MRPSPTKPKLSPQKGAKLFYRFTRMHSRRCKSRVECPQANFRLGQRFGTPTCCILDYICDRQHGRAPYRARGRVIGARGQFYVPCRICGGGQFA